MDASLKYRFARVLVAGSAALLAVACTNDMQTSQQPMQPEKVVVVKDHECHHRHHAHNNTHHKKSHHHAKHHAKAKAKAKPAADTTTTTTTTTQ